jgi:hypothetical protein
MSSQQKTAYRGGTLTMTANIKTIPQASATQAELSDNYGPIGLKAVVAAALMTKKPTKKKPA